MKLYNIRNTKNDKPKSGRDWIDVLNDYLKVWHGREINNIDNKQGAHMSDCPGDDLQKGNF